MLLVNQLTSAILQVLVLSFIPFIWYIIANKKAVGFFHWLGIKLVKKPPVKEMILIVAATIIEVILPYLWLYYNDNLTYSGFVFDSFTQTGWSVQTFLIIILWSVVQTSLSEEVFFRGFLMKRLIHKFGYKIANLTQAAIFGLIHSSATYGQGIVPTIVIVALTSSIGYSLGYLMHKKANDSILYGWVIHASYNVVSPILVFTFLL